MHKKTQFENYLNEPQLFSDGSWVINAEIPKEQFYEMIKKEDCEAIAETTLEDFLKVVKINYVSFRGGLDDDYEFRNMRWLEANPDSNKSKKVRTY